MFKKMALSMLVLIMTLSLLGCNQTSVDLLNDLERSSNWEAINQDQSMVIEMNFGDENVVVDLSMTSYVNNENIQMEAELTINSVSYNGMKFNLSEGMFKVSPFKIYLDGYKLFMSTQFLKDINGIMDGGLDDEMDLTREYIALDMKEYLEMTGIDINEMVDMQKESLDLLKSLDVDLPINKNGDTYTIDLDDSEMVNIFFDYLLEVSKAQLELYYAAGATNDEIAQLKVELEDMYGKETREEIIPYIEGSKTSGEFMIGENNAISNIDLQINISKELTGVESNISIRSTTNTDKAPCREVKFPTDVRVYDIEELMYGDLEQVPPSEMLLVEVKMGDILYINGENYVPAKSALANIGLTLVYDQATKKVCIAEYDNEPIDLLIVNGVSYLSFNQMNSFGMEVIIVED